MLRYLISNWIREQAQQHVMKTVQDAVSGGPTGNDRPGAARSARPSAGKSPPGGNASADEQAAPEIPPTEPVAIELAFVFAMAAEAGGLTDKLQDMRTLRGEHYVERIGMLAGRPVSIIECGVGRERAAAATADLLEVRQPGWVISAGFAGGLQKKLARGNILMADSVGDTTGRSYAVGLKIDPAALAATPGVHVGRLVTVDKLLRKPAEKRQLGEEQGGLACDLESIAVAAECSKAGTRFLSIRVISDTVEDELPAYLDQLIDQQTLSAQLGAAAGAIWQKPSSVKEMWQLKEDALKASDRLAKFLMGVISQLPREAPRKITPPPPPASQGERQATLETETETKTQAPTEPPGQTAADESADEAS